jgi:hypothetical protein
MARRLPVCSLIADTVDFATLGVRRHFDHALIAVISTP